MVVANSHRFGCIRWSSDLCFEWICDGSFHLQSFLRFMRILGLSCFYHDSAAALLEDGRIIAAAQEERFTRVKHDSAFPHQAIKYCLSEAGIGLESVDVVVFYEKPFIKLERLVETYLATAPRGFGSFKSALLVWAKEKFFQKRLIIEQLNEFAPGVNWSDRLAFSEHHLSHAASAFFPSPFERAAILTMDGVGEWTTTSLAIGNGNKIEMKKEIHFPHSIGLLYSAFTYYTGFRVNSGEYKVMGLAPYGEPKFHDLILSELVDLKEDGSFRLNMKYFDYCTGLKMTNRRFDRLFGGPARDPHEPLTQRHMDLAASVQSACEEIVLRLGRSIARETGEKNLCLAGGVALNCVANGKLLKAGYFDRIWIQPAAGDAGGAIGAAMAVHYLYQGNSRHLEARLESQQDGMSGAFLGPKFDNDECARRLRSVGANFDMLTDEELMSSASQVLQEGKALGWFQGRMEFGPRALGGRSILGDPRSEKMQSQLNLKVKFRESFRPFAPAILREDLNDWFDLNVDSPYMLLVGQVKERHRRKMTESEQSLFGIEKLNVQRSSIPAVTHVDYSARVQTVHETTNPRFHRLLRQFKSDTGCPVLVNTSFNVRGEPIVCTPEDAFRCFMGTDIETLAIGNCFLRKDAQNQNLKITYKEKFSLD